MAAEATATVGEVADGRPLGMSANREELYDEEVGGPVNIFDAIAKANRKDAAKDSGFQLPSDDDVRGRGSARHAAGKTSPAPSPGAIVQDSGPDELDTILTPTALGAAVGVVVGTTVGGG